MPYANESKQEKNPSLNQKVFGFDETGKDIQTPLSAIYDLFGKANSGITNNYKLSENAVTNGNFTTNSLVFSEVTTLDFFKIDVLNQDLTDYFTYLNANKADIYLKIKKLDSEVVAFFRINTVTFNIDDTITLGVSLYNTSSNGSFSLEDFYTLVSYIRSETVPNLISNSSDIKVVGNELQFEDRDKTVNSLGYKHIRSDFDFTSFPVDYDNSKLEIRDFFDYDVTPTITLPENVELVFNGGKFDNCTIVGNNTRISSGLYQIFGVGVTLTGTWDVENSYPEWFGAIGDNVTDDKDAIQKALDFDSNLKFTQKEYYVNGPLQINKLKTIDFNGCTLRFKSQSTISNGFYISSSLDGLVLKNGIIKSTWDVARVSPLDGMTSNILAFHFFGQQHKNIHIENISFEGIEVGIKIDVQAQDKHENFYVNNISSTDTHTILFTEHIRNSIFQNIKSVLPIGLTNNLDHGIYISRFTEDCDFNNIIIQNGSSSQIIIGKEYDEIKNIRFNNVVLKDAVRGFSVAFNTSYVYIDKVKCINARAGSTPLNGWFEIGNGSLVDDLHDVYISNVSVTGLPLKYILFKRNSVNVYNIEFKFANIDILTGSESIIYFEFTGAKNVVLESINITDLRNELFIRNPTNTQKTTFTMRNCNINYLNASSVIPLQLYTDVQATISNNTTISNISKPSFIVSSGTTTGKIIVTGNTFNNFTLIENASSTNNVLANNFLNNVLV